MNSEDMPNGFVKFQPSQLSRPLVTAALLLLALSTLSISGITIEFAHGAGATIVGPPSGTFSTINNSPGDHTDPHISGRLITYSEAINNAFSVRYHDLGTSADNVVPQIPSSPSLDFLSDVSGNTIGLTRVTVTTSVIMSFHPGDPSPTEVNPGVPGTYNRLSESIGAGTIAYQELSASVGAFNIIAFDISSSSVTALTSDGALNVAPSVSPGGTVVTWEKCAAVSTSCSVWSATRTGVIWIIRNLTNGNGNCQNPDSNGQIVVYSCSRGGKTSLYWKAADGTGVEQTLGILADELVPRIDGRFVSFAGAITIGAAHDIYVLDLSSMLVYQITNTPDDERLSDVSIATDGTVTVVWDVRQIYFSTYAFTFKAPVLPTTTTINCSPSSVLVGAETTCTVQVADVDTSSSSTPSGLVMFNSDKPGVFTPTGMSCDLGGSGSSAACDIKFSPSQGFVGVESLSASYNGDMNHGRSIGSFSLNVFDFSITASPSDPTALRGGSTSYSVTTSLVPGSAGAPSIVGIVVTGLPTDSNPSGLSTLALPGTGKFTVKTGTSSVGDYSVKVAGTVQGGSRSTTVNLHIYDFTVTAVPNGLQILTTGSNSYSVMVTLVVGSTTVGLPNIALAVTGLPSGTTSLFSPPGGSPSFTSTLTITTSMTLNATYALIITGTDGRTPEGGARNAKPTLVVLTPAQAIPQVVNNVSALQSSGVLAQGQAGSLITKLNNAIKDITAKPPSNMAACNMLNALVNEINSYVATGVLTQAQANTLLNGPLGIFAIMAAIPC